MKDDYLKGLLKQTLDSYKILTDLHDKPGDLDIMKRELGRIRGLTQVISNKLEQSGNMSNSYTELLQVSKAYLIDYDFSRTIEDALGLYSEDPDRIKSMRLSIISSLEDSELIFKVESMLRG